MIDGHIAAEHADLMRQTTHNESPWKAFLAETLRDFMRSVLANRLKEKKGSNMKERLCGRSVCLRGQTSAELYLKKKKKQLIYSVFI